MRVRREHLPQPAPSPVSRSAVSPGRGLPFDSAQGCELVERQRQTVSEVEAWSYNFHASQRTSMPTCPCRSKTID